jgi:ABC-type antimicrobial peptide transport system permease subunit
VLIVNQQFVRTWFPGRIHWPARADRRHDGSGFEDPVREIVGVVGDVKQTGLDAATPGIMYLSSGQIPDQMTKMTNGLLGMSWVVRTQSPNVEVATEARRIFLDNAQTPLLSVEPLSEIISSSVAQQRFSMIFLSAFGVISLILGAAGLYGVLSFAVTRQSQEIGVRMAVGAQRSDIVRMVLRNASQLIFIGLGIGVLASLAAAHLLQSLVFGIAPRNPFALAAMSCLLLATGLFAARQTAVNPPSHV